MVIVAEGPVRAGDKAGNFNLGGDHFNVIQGLSVRCVSPIAAISYTGVPLLINVLGGQRTCLWKKEN